MQEGNPCDAVMYNVQGSTSFHLKVWTYLCTYFTDELRDLFTKAGLKEEQNMVDRRLQVNRGRQLTMYRVWIQCKYRKPVIEES